MDKKFVFEKKILAERVKIARQEMKLTQESLSDKLDVDISTIGKVESVNSNRTLNYKNLANLANILDKDINYFFLSEEFVNGYEDSNTLVNKINDLLVLFSDEKKEVAYNILKELSKLD